MHFVLINYLTRLWPATMFLSVTWSEVLFNHKLVMLGEDYNSQNASGQAQIQKKKKKTQAALSMRGAAHHRYLASLFLRIHLRRHQWLQLCPAHSNCPVRRPSHLSSATTRTRTILAANKPLVAIMWRSFRVALKNKKKNKKVYLIRMFFAVAQQIHKLSHIASSVFDLTHTFANSVILKITTVFLREAHAVISSTAPLLSSPLAAS